MRINGTDIYITRGDSETINVSLFDQTDDTQRPFLSGDTVYFTVKTSTQTTNKIFQYAITEFNEDGEALVHITPQDTKSLKYHEYVYDVQMVKENGAVTTIITPSKFIVEEEVTYE